MAVDNKYGEVTTEFGEFEADEPVVVFRGRDTLLPAVMRVYMELCEVAGSPPHHLNIIDDTHRKIVEWQMTNGDKIRIPNSNSYVQRTQEEIPS